MSVGDPWWLLAGIDYPHMEWKQQFSALKEDRDQEFIELLQAILAELQKMNQDKEEE